MLIWTMLALQTAPVVKTFDLGEVRRAPAPVTASLLPRCEADESGGDIVVCGRQRKDRYRLPLPNERAEAADMPPRDAPGGMAALTTAARCGIFAGERRCSKREAARYGYGQGRDPITVLTRLARKVADPDAD
jgi:hypothetical protein